MSTVQGFPDWQRITQWLGPPIVQNTGLVIGAGTHTDGPVQVSNFASVVVALKATGGNVTVTIKQTVPAGPASLVLTSSVVVPAGATLFEAFVLYGGAVELDLTGSIAGTSVDYALYGSNTTTNAQVVTAATINVQHSEVLVAAEPTLDFVDVGGSVWSVTDDAANTRVKIALPNLLAMLGATGRTVAFGNSSWTFAAAQVSNNVNVAHGLGVAPQIVIVDGIARIDLTHAVTALGAVTFSTQAFCVQGVITDTPTFKWLAIA